VRRYYGIIAQPTQIFYIIHALTELNKSSKVPGEDWANLDVPERVLLDVNLT
jgi:hypothetical protein